jgi:hypothetical protein
MEKLILLCSRHHHLVHEGSFGLQKLADGRVQFSSPAGKLITMSPAGRSRGNADELFKRTRIRVFESPRNRRKAAGWEKRWMISWRLRAYCSESSGSQVINLDRCCSFRPGDHRQKAVKDLRFALQNATDIEPHDVRKNAVRSFAHIHRERRNRRPFNKPFGFARLTLGHYCPTIDDQGARIASRPIRAQGERPLIPKFNQRTPH